MVDDRSIRVFVSSTFRDMQAERDYLVRHTFPQLRRICAARDVAWGDVDLRWGITDEQTAEGKVLPLCLAEIRRCQPFFIGLLGERYGWIPASIPPELLDREPWIREHLDASPSITELEIICALSGAQDLSKHAFFYFREPTVWGGDSPEAAYTDDSEDVEFREKSERLKNYVRRASDQRLCTLREGFRSPQELGEQVLCDFKELIEELFPDAPLGDSLAQERRFQTTLIRAHARTYQPREEYVNQLDRYVADDSRQPLLVTGAIGSGKSALLANWVESVKAANPNDVCLSHFVGASPETADWQSVMQRLLAELRIAVSTRPVALHRDGTPSFKTVQPKSSPLYHQFAVGMIDASKSRRVVLVLDGLSQLRSDLDDDCNSIWFRLPVGPNIRVILSELPEAMLNSDSTQRCGRLEVGDLPINERRRFIAQFLQDTYSKALGERLIQAIVERPQTGNPLFLRILLTELALLGDRGQLEQYVEGYLEAQSPYELYREVLIRWHRDYSTEQLSVATTLSLVWAARRGLSELELLQILGTRKNPLPHGVWTPLHAVLAEGLYQRGSLWTLANDALRDAVRDEFLPQPADRHAAHNRLAIYFGLHSQKCPPRELDERPWQLAESQRWTDLARVLSDPMIFPEAWEHDADDVRSLWLRIERSSPIRIPQAFHLWIRHVKRNMRYSSDNIHRMLCLGGLLQSMGYLHDAFAIQVAVMLRLWSVGDSQSLGTSITECGATLMAAGESDFASVMLRAGEELLRQAKPAFPLKVNLTWQAVIACEREELDRADGLNKEAAQTPGGDKHRFHDLPDGALIAARISRKRGNANQVENQLREVERVCRVEGRHAALAWTLGELAEIHAGRGELKQAESLFAEQQRLWRRLHNPAEMRRCLKRQARLLESVGRHSDARSLMLEIERIGSDYGYTASLSHSFAGRLARSYITGGAGSDVANEPDPSDSVGDVGQSSSPK